MYNIYCNQNYFKVSAATLSHILEANVIGLIASFDPKLLAIPLPHINTTLPYAYITILLAKLPILQNPHSILPPFLTAKSTPSLLFPSPSFPLPFLFTLCLPLVRFAELRFGVR